MPLLFLSIFTELIRRLVILHLFVYQPPSQETWKTAKAEWGRFSKRGRFFNKCWTCWILNTAFDPIKFYLSYSEIQGRCSIAPVLWIPWCPWLCSDNNDSTYFTYMTTYMTTAKITTDWARQPIKNHPREFEMIRHQPLQYKQIFKAETASFIYSNKTEGMWLFFIFFLAASVYFDQNNSTVSN